MEHTNRNHNTSRAVFPFSLNTLSIPENKTILNIFTIFTQNYNICRGGYASKVYNYDNA